MAEPQVPTEPATAEDAVGGFFRFVFLDADRRLRSGWRVAAFFLSFILVIHLVLPFVLLAVTCVLVVAARGQAALGEFLGKSLHGAAFQQGLALVLTPATLLLVWPFRRWLDRRSYRSMGFWCDGKTAPDLFLGVVMGSALVMLLAGSFLLTGLYRWGGTSPAGAELAWRMLLAVAGLGAAAMLEELVFRAYMQSNLTESIGPVWSLVITNVAFALLHGANPNITLLALVNLFVAGVLLGMVYHRFRSIWAVWTMHFAWNFTMGPLLGVPVSGLSMASVCKMKLADLGTVENPDWWLLTGGPFGFEGGLAATLVMTLAIVALVIWKGRPERPPETIPRRKRKPPEPMPDARLER
jgi:membrane protease YdiL (CAAX protease family)